MFGKIQVFYESAGYGFILINFRARRFFHVSNYCGDVPPTPGMPVEFDLAPSKAPGKPDQAVHVIPATPSQVGGVS
jgi:cold shock CspA family protein